MNTLPEKANTECSNCSFKDQWLLNPSFRYFDVKRNGENMFQIDSNAAKALLCAARIASESMARAVHIAEREVMRIVMEVVASKKRVKEALEDICDREKVRKVSENGVVISNMDRMIVGNSDLVSGGPSNFDSQSRPSNSNRGMVLGPGGIGNSHIMQGDDLRGESSIGVTGKITLAVYKVSASPMNLDTAGNISNGNGILASLPSGAAEDGK